MGEAFISRRGGGGGGSIKSIQHGIMSTSLQLPSVTISSVNPQNSIVLIEQYYPVNVSYPFKLIYTAGLSETTIHLYRHSGIDPSYIRWTVIEFENVKSKQTGTVRVPPDGTNVAISEVNISKSMLVCSVNADSSSQVIDEMFFRSYLSSSTNIKFERDAGGRYDIYVRWQLIEFN